jgi:beta-aspartyl-peptidase (threonine type)
MKAKHLIYVLFIIAITGCNHNESPGYALVLHGGCGNISPESITEESCKLYKEVMSRALDTGFLLLKAGRSSLDAVEAAIRIMEDSPLFNAGKGAVFNHDGKNELDASIMEGSNLKAGAVAAVDDIKNPITAARKVMEESKHVLLSGEGASGFAREHGIEMADNSYFFTQRRWKNLQDQLETEKSKESGTVGCVALDQYGNLAAGTSTGGMTNKLSGRIGDSPIPGAGNYANNNTCAVSATGHGEFIIRYAVAHDISALMEYRNLSLREAARQVVQEKLKKAGGDCGIIGLDKKGNIVMEFNTSGMYRGYMTSDGKKEILIFRE